MKRIVCLLVAGLISTCARTDAEGLKPDLPPITVSSNASTSPALSAGKSGGSSTLFSPDRLEHNGNRFLTHCKVSAHVLPPAGGLVVVAEGDYEARSLGSYSVRLYEEDSNNAGERLFPVTIDNFKCGLIQPRVNGSVEHVLTRDLLGDGREEIIVTIRSAGRRGLISADAFRVDNGELRRIAAVNDFPAAADVVTLLSFKLNPAATGTKRWFEAVEAVARVTNDQGRGPEVGSEDWQRAVSEKVFEHTTDPVPPPHSKEWFAAINKHVLTGLPPADAPRCETQKRVETTP